MGVDFLTGMTLFILSLFFVFQLMFGVIEPYTSTSKENVEIANRAVDKLYYSALTKSDTPTGYLNYTETMDFFQNMSESEIRASLAIPDVKGYNITLLSDYTNYEPRRFLVAYWSMNERNGGTVEDMAFAGEASDTGRVVGDADLTANGVMSISLHGDSSGGASSSPGDYINVSGSSDLALSDGNQFTISAWVDPRTDQGGRLTIVNKSTDEAGVRLYINRNDLPVFKIDPGADSEKVNGVTTISADKGWYHIVGTYNTSPSSDDFKIYVNGREEDVKNADSDGVGDS
ncbi:MAG: LamG-like jellyroll fold domain-containing protein, partial [Halobacteria archaeon]|nr:LamG-like jellyroll fold domain-containing protein [Halobacteria archaeon]